MRERLSLSIPLKPENGPDEKIDDDPSDSNVVDDGPIFRLFGVGWRLELVCVSVNPSLSLLWWFSLVRWTIFKDWTTSPMVGLWFASGATQAAAIAHTCTKSSFGYLPPSLGSTSSPNRSLSLRIGRDWKSRRKGNVLRYTYRLTTIKMAYYSKNV